VIGPMIGYEVVVAFFLEATFLGVFAVRLESCAAMAAHAGGDRGRNRHADVRVLDIVGQQLDADASRIRDARRDRLSLDWLEIVFNPSFLHRLAIW